jgi:hypothetical protein
MSKHTALDSVQFPINKCIHKVRNQEWQVEIDDFFCVCLTPIPFWAFASFLKLVVGGICVLWTCSILFHLEGVIPHTDIIKKPHVV